MIGHSILGAKKGAALGSACLWLGLGCGGTSGREGLVPLTTEDASTDSFVDVVDSLDALDGSADISLDSRPSRRKPGALDGASPTSEDGSQLSGDALAEGGDGAAPLSCGFGVVATAPACDGCTNQCALTDACMACGMLDNNFVLNVPFCSKLVGVATDGPAKGESRVQLCSELLDCVARTGCAFYTFGKGSSGDYASCYCGNSPLCFQARLGTGEGGPCRDQVENAAETTEPTLILSRYVALGRGASAFALGAVMNPIRTLANDCTGGGPDGEIRCTDPSVDAGQ
jgi:hypothetical protein